MSKVGVALLVSTMMILASACADDGVEAGAAVVIPPTSPSTTSSTDSTLTYTPMEERGPAPQARLTSGELVALFEPFDHGRFSSPTVIDNPWLPMEPGTRMIYEGITREDGEQLPHRLVFTVTDLVKEIDGITSVVIWDVDYSDGDLVETELAFFAQDDRGDVWRMGEYPEEWEEGEFLDAPAWIAGVGSSRAGIAMTAAPDLDSPSYSQGWGPDVGFTDRAFILEMGTRNCIRLGCYEDVLVVNEFNDEEPGANQLKHYAPGVGNIQVGWRGDDTSIEELDLVEVIRLTPEEMDEVRETALMLDERAHILKEEVFGPAERAHVAG